VDIIWPDMLMFVGGMMFGWTITEVFKAGLVVELEVLLHFCHLKTKSISSPLLLIFAV
jgi:hypothetical protein